MKKGRYGQFIKGVAISRKKERDNSSDAVEEAYLRPRRGVLGGKRRRYKGQ